MKKATILILLSLWACLTLGAWFRTPEKISDDERRALAQMPKITVKTLENGNFMRDFEKYAVDQFPLRRNFRGLKAVVHTGLLGQKDMNDIYLYEGHAVKQEYPLDEISLRHALTLFGKIHDTYLQDAETICFALVPDKNAYLGPESGHLSISYDDLGDTVEENLPWADFLDLRDTLTADCYYRTDAHWRQETLIPTAQAICKALNIPEPKAEDYTEKTLENPFYGVYYGQAALPLTPDRITILESPLLHSATVYDYETEKTGPVYDMEKLQSRDLYDVYLSGAKSLLTVENPNAATDRELILFRDSFGSSMAPLLLQGYRRITLVDVRYIRSDFLKEYLDFSGKDVLFLYSTTVLNQSGTLQ